MQTALATNKTDLKELSHPELAAWLADRKIASYRAGQILRWVYQRQIDAFGDMTDLGKDLRLTLEDHFTVDRLTVNDVQTSADGTRKFLFALRDGQQVESVLIPEAGHFTLCVSCQVGCAMGCRFCRTAAGGLSRNLTRGEIVAQVRDIARMAAQGDPRRLTHIVFMGMGEPLANYTAVKGAIQTLTDAKTGLGMSKRRVALSTVGLVPQMAALGRDTEVKLTVSLNAADDRTRSRLMPINRTYPLDQLMAACRAYPLKPGRKITFAYILMSGINDSEADAGHLAALLGPVKAKVNLIPFNAHDGCDFKRPDDRTLLRFQEILAAKHITTRIRRGRGEDILAACGQLRAAKGQAG